MITFQLAEDELYSVLPLCSALKKLELHECSLTVEALRKLCESLESVTSLTCIVDLSDEGDNPNKDTIDVIASNLRNLE